MKLKKKNQSPTQKENFEKELLQSLKYYGYQFPESSEDVERFEALYGNTEIDFPEHLESVEKIKSNKDPQLDVDFGISNRMAAFSSNHPRGFELPDSFNLTDKEDLEGETKD